MTQTLGGFVESVCRAPDQGEVWRLGCDFFGSRGVEWLHYVYAAPVWLADPAKKFRLSTYPDWWHARYEERRYAEADPAVSHCWRSSGPLVVGLDADPTSRARRAREMYLETSEWGARSAVVFPLRSMPGSPAGGVACVTRASAGELRRRWPDSGQEMQHAALALDVALMRRHGPCAGAVPEALSGRERDCLLWLAHGLRTDRIADRLKLSPVTVEMHLARARRKLGARTRDEALVKAAMLGELCPGWT